MRRRANRCRALEPLCAVLILILLPACTPSERPSTLPVEAMSSSDDQTPVMEIAATAEATSADSPASLAGCIPPAQPSPPMAEGPYFKDGSPERTSLLEESTAGETLVLSGYVLSNLCEPIAGTRLDFWQTDGNGVYDNAGYSLRGHQFTDSAGSYELTTVIPGIYPGRTAHIHVKVEAPGRKPLTTQLFFPGAANEADRIFDARLLIDVWPAPAGWIGRFDFVLASE